MLEDNVYIFYILVAFEKLKHYVNNIGNSNTKKAPCPGLGELVNDKSFNTCTFKQ